MSAPQNGALSPRDNNSYSPNVEASGSLRRKGSFNFLRRSKSRERTVSIGNGTQRKLSKKEQAKMREEEMMREQIPASPPKIPVVPSQPKLQTFGGEDARPDSMVIMSNRAIGAYPQRLAQKTSMDRVGGPDLYRGMSVPPVPPIPSMAGQSPGQGYFERTESMAHRGRYSYASSAISTINSPRKIRRRKDPTPYNILVLGTRGSGKTTFVNFLLTSLALPSWKHRPHAREDDYLDPPPASEVAFPNFASHYVETEVDGERIGVTLWDSEGLEANVVDLQLKETTSFIESKFEDTFTEESKVARAPGFRDTHIHCAFLVLDPLRLDSNIATVQKAKANGGHHQGNGFVQEVTPTGLDENLDLNVLRALKTRTTVVPVISKADTITVAHMSHLKRVVFQSLKAHGLDTLEALNDDDDDGSETSTEHGKRQDHHDLDERDEDEAKAEEDKFSGTSHLDDPSDSSSSTSETNASKQQQRQPTVRSSGELLPTPPTEPPLLPLSIISPDPCEPEIVGRRFPWGIADPHNADHCDFTKLRQLVFTEWRTELRESSRELWYEGWRTSRLNRKSKRHGMSMGADEVRNTVWGEKT